MTEDWFSDALRERIARDEPPLGITARQAIAAGRRRRRGEVVRVATAAVGVGTVLIGASFFFDPGRVETAGFSCGVTFRTVAPTPMPTGSDFPAGDLLPGVAPSVPVMDPSRAASTGGAADTFNPSNPPALKSSSGFSAGPLDEPSVDPSADPSDPVAPDLSRDRIDQFACAVQRSVVAALPGSSFAQLRTPGWTGPQPLQAGVPIAFHVSGLMVGAVAVDRAGQGSILIEASEVTGRPEPERCRDGSLCDLRTGPHGEVIEVYERTRPDGAIGYTIYVYTGHTAVVASVHNSSDVDGRWPITRPTPPLTVLQLVEIACDPDLVLWP
jgi:hypothetical protein